MAKGQIVGTGSAAPKMVLTNQDLEEIVDTSDDWIVRRTGIRERRIASAKRQESASDLAALAASRAMEMAGVSHQDIDMIIVGTATPDRQFPSVACLVQQQLGVGNAPAFDVAAGCSGFVYAMHVANNLIVAGSCHNVLVIGAERLSTVADWQDRSTCVLLGDGAGAVVLTSGEDETGILSSHLNSDGNSWDLLYSKDRVVDESLLHPLLAEVSQRPSYLIMNGNKLFKKAVSCLAGAANAALEYNNLSAEDIAMLVPHQANMRIIRATADKLSIPMEKVYTNIEKYGNTSAASIPIALDEANRKGVLRRGDYILLVAFGAGLTWGASIVKWSKDPS
jgi:3-oxoacyl-[acyl-carrier-protein] synthase-3